MTPSFHHLIDPCPNCGTSHFILMHTLKTTVISFEYNCLNRGDIVDLAKQESPAIVIYLQLLAGLFGAATASSVLTLDIALDHQPERKTVVVDKRTKEKLYVFTDGEDVSGVAVLSLRPGKKAEHGGIRVDLIGEISAPKDSSCPKYQFFRMSKDLEPPGTLLQSQSRRWKFGSVDKAYDSYYGKNVKLRYIVRLTVERPFGGSLTKEVEFATENYAQPECIPTMPIKMEVGIEDCLHLDFEYDRNAFHLKDVVTGRVNFVVVRIKIKYMELDIIRSEILKQGGNANAVINSETVAKFEIMDGAAGKGEVIPVRLYLDGFNLSPTLDNVANRFTVKYYLNLVLVDEEDRRYFKKQEILLYRKAPAGLQQSDEFTPTTSTLGIHPDLRCIFAPSFRNKKFGDAAAGSTAAASATSFPDLGNDRRSFTVNTM